MYYQYEAIYGRPMPIVSNINPFSGELFVFGLVIVVNW